MRILEVLSPRQSIPVVGMQQSSLWMIGVFGVGWAGAIYTSIQSQNESALSLARWEAMVSHYLLAPPDEANYYHCVSMCVCLAILFTVYWFVSLYFVLIVFLLGTMMWYLLGYLAICFPFSFAGLCYRAKPWMEKTYPIQLGMINLSTLINCINIIIYINAYPV